jgi:Fe-Mn family superoxide dismutase
VVAFLREAFPSMTGTGAMTHLLPALPYAVSALEPHIDARTMMLHHDRHHGSYVTALNLALAAAPEPLRQKTAEWLLLNPGKIPENIRGAVRNNAGGHVNHGLLWRAMAPDGGGQPTGKLAEAIEHGFGSFEKFKTRFEEAGRRLFGSGWVWLARTQNGDGKLQILTTSGHDNPLAQGCFPLLVNDVWEHAYYLKHENRRPEYLAGWWPVVNWPEAARRLAQSDGVELSAPTAQQARIEAPA